MPKYFSGYSTCEIRCKCRGQLVTKSKLLINRFVATLWLEHGLSENTQQAYRKDVELFESWLENTAGLELVSVTPDLIQSYLAFRLGKGAKASSSARSLSSLKRFYRYAKREGLVEIDPTSNIESPKLGRKLPTTMTEAEVDALLNAPDANTAIGQRDFAMIDLMYSSGLRVSELVTLRTYQYDGSRGFVRVTGKGAKERLVPVAVATSDTLQRYISETRPLLLAGNMAEDIMFPSSRAQQMTRQTFWHRIKFYAAQLGIQSSLSPHTLRHAFATHLVNNGADLRVVQMLLGHSSLSTTQIYTYVAQERMQSLHATYHPRA